MSIDKSKNNNSVIWGFNYIFIHRRIFERVLDESKKKNRIPKNSLYLLYLLLSKNIKSEYETDSLVIHRRTNSGIVLTKEKFCHRKQHEIIYVVEVSVKDYPYWDNWEENEKKKILLARKAAQWIMRASLWLRDNNIIEPVGENQWKITEDSKYHFRFKKININVSDDISDKISPYFQDYRAILDDFPGYVSRTVFTNDLIKAHYFDNTSLYEYLRAFPEVNCSSELSKNKENDKRLMIGKSVRFNPFIAPLSVQDLLKMRDKLELAFALAGFSLKLPPETRLENKECNFGLTELEINNEEGGKIERKRQGLFILTDFYKAYGNYEIQEERDNNPDHDPKSTYDDFINGFISSNFYKGDERRKFVSQGEKNYILIQDSSSRYSLARVVRYFKENYDNDDDNNITIKAKMLLLLYLFTRLDSYDAKYGGKEFKKLRQEAIDYHISSKNKFNSVLRTLIEEYFISGNKKEGFLFDNTRDPFDDELAIQVQRFDELMEP